MQFFRQYGIRILIGLTILLGLVQVVNLFGRIRPIPAIFNPLTIVFYCLLVLTVVVLIYRSDLSRKSKQASLTSRIINLIVWITISIICITPVLFFGFVIYIFSDLQDPIKDSQGVTYYVQSGFPDDDTCSDYVEIFPGIVKDTDSQYICQGNFSVEDQQVTENVQSSNGSLTSDTSPEPLTSDSSAESVPLPSATPPAAIAQDSSAYLLPTSFTDSTGQKVQAAISYQSTGFYAVIRKNGLWQPTESLITSVGANGNPDPYAFATANEKVWFFDTGGTHANHLFITQDGGSTWSSFAPAGLDQSEGAPNFLQTARYENGFYTVEMNYPTWAGTNSNPVIFTSTDGSNWSKK